MRYIKRKLEGTILRFLKEPEILAVVGPRQCGKTTMLQRICGSLGKRAVFLSFEDRKTLDLFENNTDDFIDFYSGKYDYIFIDEFQYVKAGGRLLKYWYDLKKRSKIIVSGSSNIDLTVKAVKFLVGRILIFELYPFDFEEFLSAKDKNLLAVYKKLHLPLPPKNEGGLILNKPEEKKLQKYFQEYAVYGGYPRVVLAEAEQDKKEFLQNIYNTFFLREVHDVLGLIEDYKMAKLMQGLALQIGNLIEYHELSVMSELSHQTVKKYLNFLSKTFTCTFIRPFYTNRRTQIVKNPKVYFYDAGMRNYILNNFRGVASRSDAGALLENALCSQLIKQKYAGNFKLHFWRSKKQDEVDFVLDLPESRQIALEVKKTLKANFAQDKSVRQFSRLYPHIPLWQCFLEKGRDVSGGKNLPIFLI